MVATPAPPPRHTRGGDRQHPQADDLHHGAAAQLRRVGDPLGADGRPATAAAIFIAAAVGRAGTGEGGTPALKKISSSVHL